MEYLIGSGFVGLDAKILRPYKPYSLLSILYPYTAGRLSPLIFLYKSSA
jgi:hypothetical protein